MIILMGATISTMTTTITTLIGRGGEVTGVDFYLLALKTLLISSVFLMEYFRAYALGFQKTLAFIPPCTREF
jgi:hypothetical protein